MAGARCSEARTVVAVIGAGYHGSRGTEPVAAGLARGLGDGLQPRRRPRPTGRRGRTAAASAPRRGAGRGRW